jgi:Dolichyl-phosphate-mannose-protein mannosyltransferase
VNRIALPLLMALFLGNAVAQVLLEGDGLDNQTVNSYLPEAADADGYASRAEQLARGQLVAPFRDAYRLPGYPLFLSVFYRLSPQPLLAARYAQILLSASIPVLLFFVFLNVTGSYAKAYAGAVIVGLWAPLYYFSPVILAESCSIVLVGALLLCLSRVTLSQSLPGIYAIPVLVASLVYLKPQHVLLFLPCVGFLIVARGKASQRHLVGVGLVMAALLAPWTLFASLTNHTFVPLSTTSCCIWAPVSIRPGRSRFGELFTEEWPSGSG